jgi:hypothetical protein
MSRKRNENALKALRVSAAIDREIVLSQGGNAVLIWLSGGSRAGAHYNAKRAVKRGSSRKVKHKVRLENKGE